MANKRIAYLLYQSFQLTHGEKDIKNFIKSKSCQRKFLLDFFEVQCSPKEPFPFCCDNCSLACECGLSDCKVVTYPSARIRLSCSESQKMCEVSDEQTAMLRTELNQFHVSLLMLLLKRDASGNLKIFNHPSLLWGFSDTQISQVLRYCSLLFTVKDICNFVEIWDLLHAHKVHTIM